MRDGTSDAVKDFLDEGVDGVLVFRVHLLGIAIGYDHAAGHGAMAEERGEASKC